MSATDPRDPFAILRLGTDPGGLEDARLAWLKRAQTVWDRGRHSERKPVDQVYLVHDLEAFLEALTTWDQQTYFPILFDDPAWVLPFLREYRPARVIRYERVQAPAADREDLWDRAVRAVVASWGSEVFKERWSDEATARGLASEKRRIQAVKPGHDQPRAPGAVLADPQARMFAGALALAAGRRQALIRMPALPGSWNDRTNLTPNEASQLAVAVERTVAAVIPRHARIGDECDFLTLACDWPFRYQVDPRQPRSGFLAVDDLIGRRIETRPPRATGREAPRRWAYTGRLLGDPAASVARAMAALFLQPHSATLWNTYESRESPWKDYRMDEAGDRIRHSLGSAATVLVQEAQAANLSAWQSHFDGLNSAGLIMVNSVGGPENFLIPGGPGFSVDVGWGKPCIAAMIHSFSASNPGDQATIAGRWLAQGAFVYFGSIDEPFLVAFRRPRLVSALIEAGVPLIAALRQGEQELFGGPWKLVYLGDPLYRIDSTAATASTVARSSRIQPTQRPPGVLLELARRQHVIGSSPDAEFGNERPDPSSTAEARLDRALRRAIHNAISYEPGSPEIESGHWFDQLRDIPRQSLEPTRRSAWDALAIDTGRRLGLYDELRSLLLEIPFVERSAEVWSALEACHAFSIARETAKKGPSDAILSRWEQVLRERWPADSHFPSEITERVAVLMDHVPHGRALWAGRLQQVQEAIGPEAESNRRAVRVALERVLDLLRQESR